MVVEDTMQKTTIDEAIQRLEVATSLRTDNPEYFYYLGKAYALGQFHEKAVSALQKTVALNQTNADYYYLLSRELRATGSAEDAKFHLNKVISLNRYYRDAYLQLADIFYGEKNWKETASHSRSALGISWDDSAFSMLIASLYHEKEYQDIIIEKEKAKNFTVSAKAPSTAFYIARALSQMNRWQEASNLYTALAPFCTIPDVSYYHGCACANDGRYQDAFDLFSRLIQGSEKTVPSRYYLQRGHVLMKLEKIQDALADYTLAHQNDPDNPGVLYALARWNLKAGEHQAAMDYIVRAKDQNISPGKFHLLKGLIHEQSHEIDDAISEYKLALEAENTPVIQKRLGIAYTKKGCHEEALQYLSAAGSAGDTTDTLQYYLAFNHAKTGNFPPAVEIWNGLSGRSDDPGISQSLNSAISSANYLLGRSLVETNNYTAAINAWEAYCHLVTGDEVTHTNIAELYFRQALNELRSSPENNGAAIPLLQKAYSMHSDGVIALYWGILNLRLGNISTAMTVLSTLRQNFPESERVGYYFALGSFMNNDGNGLSIPGAETSGSYQNAFEILRVLHDVRTKNWAGITGLLEPRFENGGVSRPDVNTFLLRAYATALIQNHDYSRVGALVERYISEDEHPYALHLRALDHANNHRYDEALVDLAKLLTLNPEHKSGKELATKLLLRRIAKNMATSNINAITFDIDLLLRVHPEGLDQIAGASSLKNYLPLVYLKSGQREKCAGIWEEKLIQNPENSEVLHWLAVLYYWWTLDEETEFIEKDPEGIDTEQISSLWVKTISYFVMLKYSREFWEDFKGKKESARSRPGNAVTIPAENMRTLRNKPLDRLHTELQRRVQEYHSKGWHNAAERIDHYIILLDLEQISASKLNSFITTYHDRLTDQPRIRVCGNSMISILRMQNDMDSLIAIARNRFTVDPLIDELSILMSPLGYIHMLTQRNLFARALEHFSRLPEAIRQSPDGKTILARISLKKAELKLDSEYPESAIDDFIEISRNSSDISMLNKLAEEIARKLFVKTSQLDSREKHQEGIKILEQLLKGLDEAERQVSQLSLSSVLKEVKEHLAALYTNFGWKPMNEKRYDVAENAFRKALEYSPGYQRAKEGFSLIYNNKGVDRLNAHDTDGGMTLLEKAQSYQDTSIVRKNLAQAYALKAVELAKSPYRSPMQIFELMLKANRMDPSNEEIRQALLAIQSQMRGR